MKKPLILLLTSVQAPLAAQVAPDREIVLVPGFRQEFRGMAALGDELWAAGEAGTYARSLDGGRSWKAGTIPGAEGLFLVDVQVLGRDTACVLATSFDSGLGRVYRTDDGGQGWSLAFELAHPNVFLDGMAFWTTRAGIAFGDPVDGAFVVLRTSDGCRSWSEIPAEVLPPPLEGEAGFAASGTAIAVAGLGHAWIGTGGGSRARVLHTSDGGQTWTAQVTPMAAGPTTGIFGIAFSDTLHGVAVGGNYQLPKGDSTGATPTVLTTTDGGQTWSVVNGALPEGVRYGVMALGGGRYVAAGPSGLGVTSDHGATWTTVDTLYTYALYARGTTAWTSGPSGWIARLGLEAAFGDGKAPGR